MGKNVMTTNLYHKVMSIVREIVGDNAEGLYIDEDVAYGDLSQGDCYIVTNFEDQSVFMIDDVSAKDIEVDAGITKLVLIPKNLNYVIKIPFTGVYTAFYKNEDGSTYYEFVSCADGDICAEENSIYEEVSELGASLLEPNIFVGLYNDYLPIYIQKKVNMIACDDPITLHEDAKTELYSESELKIAKYLYRKKGEILVTESYLALMIRTYGIKTTCKIYKELRPLVSDLHRGNYGRRKDGTVVLFDYGGYDSSRWSKDF